MRQARIVGGVLCALTGFVLAAGAAGQAVGSQEPPRVAAARQFLARRGWRPEQGIAPRSSALHVRRAQLHALVAAQGSSTSSSTWTSLGPLAVNSARFGQVTGRVTALALDPADTTGNRLYVGTTGGGVWVSSNAATASASSVSFTPLTDAVAALSGVIDASISIGALTVQPGATGVILAGTGDPNDMMDSYYGAGILRSTDGGNSWSLIASTNDVNSGLGIADYSFVGEGFAGFAWSTKNTQLVVAAVSQAYGGVSVNAVRSGRSYQGLYFSTDAGATWHLATIKDGSTTMQGPKTSEALPDGNAATSVVWNPVRGVFVAAVRYHGYYQSSDGITWTRMSSQPGTKLTTTKCPVNMGGTGSTGCPIYRGTLAVNPVSGDTFAWTVDAANLDQGLWQDACSIASGACASTTISFSKQWDTAALQSTVSGGTTGIADGSYTLALAAVPQDQDTILLAGADDLWRCSLAQGCVWRNTTNTATCMSAGVAPYQHALTYSTVNPLEIFAGNDSGLWRSMDAIGQTGAVCSASDADHFQNLNAGLGSLSDVESLGPIFDTPYTLLAGLGVNGVAGVKASAATDDWPQILGGYGGPVAIDATNTSNWYVNNATGVSIYRCSQSSACTPADFGTSPLVTSASVGGDGATMDRPAQFLVDPLDTTQLLVGTCRVWRGPASGSGWTSANALSTVLDGSSSTGVCQGNGLIRSMAALPLASGGETIYVGLYGAGNGGGNLAGHILKATIASSATGTVSWTDVTGGAVTGDTNGLNAFNYDISSLFVDPHDATGKTVYATVGALQTLSENVQTVYKTTDGGASWMNLTGNLPNAPANAVVVDPQNSGTVYVATDAGVYVTSNLAGCTQSPYICWSQFGSGLPLAPAVALASSPAGTSNGVLVAATYGRGIWTTPLSTAGTVLTSASADPASLDFGSQVYGTTSAVQIVKLWNTGAKALAPAAISMPDDYQEQDTCKGKTVAAGAYCTIQVYFRPSATGARNGTMTIKANVYGGELTVDLTGTGTSGGTMAVAPVTLDFGLVAAGSTSAAQSAMVTNAGSTAVSVTSAVASSPFTVVSDTCSGQSLAANSACQITVAFAPTAAGAASGTLIVTDSAGTQTVALTGTGGTAATDVLSATSLNFPATASGALSAAQTLTLTNSGAFPLKTIALAASGPFQESDTCGAQLAAGSSCTISVVFAPASIGSLTGTLTLSDVLRTQIVALSGQGVATPVFSVSPTSLTFANQTVGVASAAQTVTVTNAGAVAMANVGFQLTGVAAASYSLVSNTCGSTLAAGASCSAGVVFIPSGAGAISAALAVSSSTANVVAVSIPINGTGQVSSGLTGTPAQIGFGAVGVGLTGTAQTVTVTNGSGSAIVAPTLSVVSPFTLASNTCAGTLAAGGSCSAVVNFAPAVVGVYSGALTAVSSSVASTLSVTLSGVGFDFNAVAKSSTATVAAGQSASYTMTIDALSGTSGTFTYTYTCGTLPSYALCTFNPTSTTVASGVEGYVTISISTGKAKAALDGGPARWRIAPLLCGFIALPLVLFRRRKALWMAVLLTVLAGAMSSCSSAGINGGGSGGSGTGNTTPAGTYTIPVTVTSTGISHTVSLTLTVN